MQIAYNSLGSEKNFIFYEDYVWFEEETVSYDHMIGGTQSPPLTLKKDQRV